MDMEPQQSWSCRCRIGDRHRQLFSLPPLPSGTRSRDAYNSRRNWWRNTSLGLVAALCSVSSASLSQPRAMSIKMSRTRKLGARSDIW